MATYNGVTYSRLKVINLEADTATVANLVLPGNVLNMLAAENARIGGHDPAKAPLNGCDVVFFATPHGVAMAQAPERVLVVRGPAAVACANRPAVAVRTELR